MSEHDPVVATLMESPVQRLSPGAAKVAQERPTSGGVDLAAGAQWALMLALAMAALAPIGREITRGFEAYTLVHADEGTIRDRLVAGVRGQASTDEMEILSELALDVAGAETALQAARKTVEADAARYHVWARIAWLETEIAGRFTAEAQAALQQSMVLCPLCSDDLVRWRFNFVLTHWRETPEMLRRLAFEQADILRWRGENAEFLAEMRIKAIRAGIPFDAYRSDVDTPVRSWDLRPQDPAQAQT